MRVDILVPMLLPNLLINTSTQEFNPIYNGAMSIVEFKHIFCNHMFMRGYGGREGWGVRTKMFKLFSKFL